MTNGWEIFDLDFLLCGKYIFHKKKEVKMTQEWRKTTLFTKHHLELLLAGLAFENANL